MNRILAHWIGGGSLIAALCGVGCPSLAQSPSQADTVTVLGLRTGATAPETGTAVAVISAGEIERRGLVFASDALATFPGVAVSQAGALGGVASVRIRGNASGQTLVLIDGAPVNDVASPGGAFDFGSLELFGIEQIEVLRGPQSTLWGGDAIGGVVSIVTASPTQGLDWRGFAEAGSFESLRAGASIGGGNERAQGRISGSWHASDGISSADKRQGAREADGYETTSVQGKGRLNLTDALRLEASLRWSATDNEFDGFPAPLFVLADTDERQTSENLTGRVAMTLDAFGGRWQQVGEVVRTKIDRETFAGSATSSRNEGERTLFRYTGRLRASDRQSVWIGAEREETRADEEEATANAVFALYSVAPMEGLNLTAGVRRDEDDRFGSETTGRATASWQALKGLRVRASWGQGFKPPSLFQTNFICGFCGLTSPNRDLKAETSEAVDAGVDVRIGEASASVTVFDQETDNLIDFDFARGYANIARARQRGVEVSFLAPVTGWLDLKAGYAHVDAKDGTGAPLPRIPKESGSVELVLSPDGPLTVSLAVRHNGRQPDGFGPDVEAWTRADLAAAYRFRSGVELYTRIENLTDEDYQQVGGYGTPGLSGVVGVRVSS
jgi:vitamin B12 transporter